MVLHECLVPDCKSGEPVIQAHSIQERRVLDLISVDKHVYMIPNKDEGVVLDRIGIHKATRFTGFCSIHDNELFDSVDLGNNREVDIENPEDLIRLSLRAIACEYWKKCNGRQFWNKLRDISSRNSIADMMEFINVEEREAEELVKHIQLTAKPQLLGINKAVERIGRQYHSLFAQLESRKYHLSKFCTFTMAVEPLVAAAAHFPPEFSNTGKRMSRRKMGVDFPEVTLNLLPTSAGTHVIFLWHRRYERQIRPFFNDIVVMGDEERALLLSQMLLIQCENVALSPRLVDSWNEREKEKVLHLFTNTLRGAIPYSSAWDIDLFSIRA